MASCRERFAWDDPAKKNGQIKKIVLDFVACNNSGDQFFSVEPRI